MDSLELFSVHKTDEEIRDTVLINIVKMLTNRAWLKSEEFESNIKKLTSQTQDTTQFNVKLQPPHKTLIIKLYGQKISTVSKTLTNNDFFLHKRDHPKMLIVKTITGKARQALKKIHPNIEVFKETNLLIDLITFSLIPKHELLTGDQLAELKTYYKDTDLKRFPRIYDTDPVALYYRAKRGQIFRIHRPSLTSGLSIFYRIVVSGIFK